MVAVKPLAATLVASLLLEGCATGYAGLRIAPSTGPPSRLVRSQASSTRLELGSKVTLRLSDGRALTGILVAISPDSVTVRTGPRDTIITIAIAAILSISQLSSGVSLEHVLFGPGGYKGALVFGALMALAAMLLAHEKS